MPASLSARLRVAPRPSRSAWLTASALAALACASCAAATGDEAVGTTSSALSITGIFPTGESAAGAQLAIGTTDPHYTLSSNDTNFPGPHALTVDPILSWVAAGASSRWISVRASAVGTFGDVYTYTTTFTLAGVDPATATLTGQWACDDSCTLNLNGAQVATNPTPGWLVASTFTIPAGGPFQLGTNTLSFVVTNGTGGPTGLQVLSISGTVSGCNSDDQCASTQFCNTQTATCVSKIPNASPIPVVTNHSPTLDGTCTAAAGTAVCVSAICDVIDNDCGLANGDGPCTVATGPTVCRSGACSVNGKCEPSGGCNEDGDCSATQTCDVTTHGCKTLVVDAGVDAGADAGGLVDAGPGAGVDAGEDASEDAEVDAGARDASTADAGPDGGADAGTDAGVGTGADASADAGTTEDAGADTGAEADTGTVVSPGDDGSAGEDATVGPGEGDATTGNGEDGSVTEGDGGGFAPGGSVQGGGFSCGVSPGAPGGDAGWMLFLLFAATAARGRRKR